MKNLGQRAALWVAAGLSVVVAACGGGGGSTTPPPVTTYVLTVNSASPSSAVAITVSPADNSGNANGSTSFTRTYNSGTAVTLTAAATAGGNKFSAWTGCTSASTVTCNVTMSTNITVSATYAAPAVSSVTVTPPNPASAVIGTTVQFSAAVAGGAVTDNTVTWSVTPPSGSLLSAGTIDKAGLYTTPYPAPATVTVTATSNQDSTVSGSVTVTLSQPAAGAGPALTVDAGNQTHAINPYIYGMNYYQIQTAAAQAVQLPVDRWGGDATSRYNYVLDVTSSASDWYFENQQGLPGGSTNASSFTAMVDDDNKIGAKTLGTVPVLGWVAKDATSCSFSTTTFPNQQKVSPDRGGACGNGVYPDGVSGCTQTNGCNVTGNDPTLTSKTVDATWTTNWVNALVAQYGNAASGKGVAIYDLDNEPSWWDAVHRDVHPNPFTYDEVTNNGLAVAEAIKTADPTAEVSGPVMDYWWAYFYSKKDIEAGWANGPCYQPWDHPADRDAHGGTPLIEYYLKQFAAYEAAHKVRLLDYLDLHTYFAGQYPLNSSNGVGLTTAGDTGAQQVRLNSTRALWDPTYTDPDTGAQPFPQPNYSTDANYTTDCTKAQTAQAPQAIRMMKNWVANDYPGTKLAITEYNWGGQENINGAVAQADILGIFGREGLDLGTLWGPPDPSTQVPGLMAFEIYRNYDGKNATFGDMAVLSTSADQGKLSVYGALRTKDNTITIVVVNKTYGDLTSTLSLDNLAAATTSAQAYLYSNANLAAIVAQPAVTVTPPASGSTTSTLATTFPAQSITLLVVPN